MNLTEKQIEDHKAWLQDQKPAHQAYVGVLIADKLTAAHPAEPAGKGEEQNWLPTPKNINALPEPLRKYIADLETNADPAGTIRELVFAKDTIRALTQPGLVTVPREYAIDAKRVDAWSCVNEVAALGRCKQWCGDKAKCAASIKER